MNRKNIKKSSKTNNKDKKPNTILWIGLVVILVPCLILLYILLGTKEKAGQPVVGDRFEGELDPGITDEQLNSIREALVFENAENVEVNLISATLRITINAKDDISSDGALALANSAYDKVMEVLPVETYFTNVKDEDGKMKTKMYDIEVQVYNVLKQDNPNNIGLIYFVKSKSANMSEPILNNFASPKNEEVANELLNPAPPEAE
ncbi:MAG: hypothetical protein HFG16_07810 [Erysipelotrichaceae bacterium]|jgi:hypothetical protein|nr:hypothetical protein [Erysipelotrichaceae bacterium]